MKTLRQFSIAFTIAALFTSSAVFAQMKVGTNPTAIEANSNLEVEASTTGRKVKIDKTSGQLTIADGTQGAGKVLTSDADGGASWQTPVKPVLLARIQGFDNSGDVNQNLTLAGVDFNDIPGASVDVSSGVISLPAGTYKVNASISTLFFAANIANTALISLAVNGSLYQRLGSAMYSSTNYHVTAEGNSVFKLLSPGQINVVGGALTTGGASGFPGSAFRVLTGGEYSTVTVEKIQ